MAVPDVDVVCVTSQAFTIDVFGKAFASQMARQAIMADNKFNEYGVEESVANRYATTGKPNATEG